MQLVRIKYCISKLTRIFENILMQILPIFDQIILCWNLIYCNITRRLLAYNTLKTHTELKHFSQNGLINLIKEKICLFFFLEILLLTILIDKLRFDNNKYSLHTAQYIQYSINKQEIITKLYIYGIRPSYIYIYFLLIMNASNP